MDICKECEITGITQKSKWYIKHVKHSQNNFRFCQKCKRKQKEDHKLFRIKNYAIKELYNDILAIRRTNAGKYIKHYKLTLGQYYAGGKSWSNPLNQIHNPFILSNIYL